MAAVRQREELPVRTRRGAPEGLRPRAAVSANDVVGGSMLLADSYPFLEVMWTMVVFFVWVAWFMLLFRIIGDVFRRRDIGGGSKALWLAFVIFLPFLGVFVYLIAQGSGMTERSISDAQAQQQQFDQYVQSVAGSGGGGGAAGEINKAKQLLDSNTITQAEFDALKVKALAA